jgi:ribosomal protein S12 methylthiotransferase accessory factor
VRKIDFYGEGRFFNALLGVLEDEGLALRQIESIESSSGPLLVTAFDCPDSVRDGTILDEVRKRDLTWLPVRVDLGEVTIGPFSVPGAPGCFSCVEVRRSRARPDATERAAIADRYREQLSTTGQGGLTSFVVGTVAALVARWLSHDPAHRTGEYDVRQRP